MGLKTKFDLWRCRHARLLSGLQFALLVLVISAASGLAGSALIRISYVEHLAALSAQHTDEIQRIQEMNAERLAEKDGIIASQGDLITSLTDRLAEIAGKTDRAAGKANEAATRVNEAAKKVDRAIQDSAPPRRSFLPPPDNPFGNHIEP